MLVIRLFRTGKKNQPSFKIVVNEKTKSSKAGRYLEEVGFWNPLTKEKSLKQERIKYWLSVGAKPSDTIYNFLVSEKIIEGKKTPMHKKSKKKGKTEIKEEVKKAPKTEVKEAPKAEVKEAPKAETPPKEASKELSKEEAPKEEIQK